MVQLIFNDGRHLMSTFSLKPALPSAVTKRGLRKEEYLEIDPLMARAFGIYDEGVEV